MNGLLQNYTLMGDQITTHIEKKTQKEFKNQMGWMLTSSRRVPSIVNWPLGKNSKHLMQPAPPACHPSLLFPTPPKSKFLLVFWVSSISRRWQTGSSSLASLTTTRRSRWILLHQGIIAVTKWVCLPCLQPGLSVQTTESEDCLRLLPKLREWLVMPRTNPLQDAMGIYKMRLT